MFGRTGQVAIEILRQAGQHHITAVGRDQSNLADPENCARLIAKSDADLVLNAAAYTAVDRAETEPEQAFLVNSAAPIAMAKAAQIRGLPFIHISTDYVFDGTGENSWQEDDTCNPLGIYGQSKYQGELGILETQAAAIILRTSWVYSAHGNNFVKTMLRLGKVRETLNVVYDQVGGPTAAPDIAKTLLDIAAQFRQAPEKRGIYHFSGSPDVSWKDFAAEIFKKSALKTKIIGIPTSAYPTPAQRPLNSRLDCSRLLAQFGIARPDWKASLTDVLRELGELA